jgi:hypothetical protein
MIASALTKTHVFPQPGGPLTEQGVRVDAVHEAFLRLTPLLTDSSRRLHGWTDRQVELSIGRLRDDVADVKAAASGGPSVATPPGRNAVPLEPEDSLKLGANLHTRLAEFAQLLRGRPRLRAAAL